MKTIKYTIPCPVAIPDIMSLLYIHGKVNVKGLGTFTWDKKSNDISIKLDKLFTNYFKD